MSSHFDPGALSSDELIVAFLDGELDGDTRRLVEARVTNDREFRERFQFFSENSISMQAAFGALLDDAPTKQLVAALPDLKTMKQEQAMPSRRRLLAGAACVLLGAVIGGTFVDVSKRQAAMSAEGWRSVVANYMRLYSTVTLSSLRDDPGAESDQIARISNVLQLPLDPDKLAIDGIPFKRAQLLVFNDKPLAQIAYLDPQRGPLALCIIKNSAGEMPVDEEERFGMNVVFWSSPSHSFMLIGRNPPDELRSIASHFQSSLVS